MLGLSFITEGAIPFAAEDPFRVIPSIMVGSAVTGALSALFGIGLHVPHGGIWVMFIPGVVDNLHLYFLSILIGTVVTAGMLFILKRPIAAEEEAAAVPNERSSLTMALWPQHLPPIGSCARPLRQVTIRSIKAS